MSSVEQTLADRGKDYGSYGERCKVEQSIKRAFAEGRQWAAMPDEYKSALEMIATKASRIVDGNNPAHHDSWHDIAGYAQLAAECAKPTPSCPRCGATDWTKPRQVLEGDIPTSCWDKFHGSNNYAGLGS